jgi:hypothetical protein
MTQRIVLNDQPNEVVINPTTLDIVVDQVTTPVTIAASGPQGIPGVAGAQGPQGPQGTQGIQGIQGTQGIQGIQGDQGLAGDTYQTTSDTELEIVSSGEITLTVGTGLSYSTNQTILISHDFANHMHAEVDTYNSGTGVIVAQVTGFEGSGTYDSWEVNLSGAVGAQGAQGIQGEQGTQGIQGEQGIQGIQGIQGETGPTGATGATGVVTATAPATYDAPTQTIGVTLGTSGTSAAAGNDARLSDARTPLAHASSHNAGGSDALAIDAVAATGSLRTLGTSSTSAAAGNDARLSDDRYPNASYWETFELINYGAANTIATAGLHQANGNQLATSSLQLRWAYVRPHRTLTVSKMSMAIGGTNGLTGFQVGIYTTAANGTAYNLTLVARTSGTAFGTGTIANGLYTAALDTAGGYPSTYTLNAGTLYVFAFVANATTSAGNHLTVPAASQLMSYVVPMGDNVGISSAVLPATRTSAAAVGTNARPWIRADE